MDLDEIKLFLRVDNEDDDKLIISLQTSAELYMFNAGCAKDYNNELYKHAIRLLISHWYDNRGLIGNDVYIRHSLDSIIYQIKQIGDINEI